MHQIPWRRLEAVDRLLARAERGIALISRARPTNAAAEAERLSRAWSAGIKEPPRFRYAPVPDFGELRRQLELVGERSGGLGAISELYEARAQELVLETQMVERIGTRELVVLSTRRFSVAGAGCAAEVAGLAESWSSLAESSEEPTFRSDDERSPESLVVQLRTLVGKLRLPVSIEVTSALTAAAATGERTIFVGAGRALTARAATRISHHEVHGHALPRLQAARESFGLFGVASARGNDEQEGYALWLEEQAELMDDARKRELAYRHLAAQSVQDGADFVQSMELLSERGASLDLGLSIASRAHRAGGLAREVVYLNGYARVSSAATDPEVVDWLARGRLSLEAIAALRSHPEIVSGRH